MRVEDILTSEEDILDWKASRELCKSARPDGSLGASALASCKAQGLRRRQTGKSQLKGKDRVKLQGKKAKATKYGGWVHPSKTG